MKLRYPIAMLSLFIAFLTLSACNKDEVDEQPEPTLEEKLVGKWTMDAAIADHIDYGVNYQDTTTFTSNDYFDFKADGTVSISATGVSYNGNWSVSADSLQFAGTGYVDFPGGFRVVTLSGSELKLSHIQNNPPDHWLDAKLHFKK